MNQQAGGMGQTKGKATRQGRVKPRGRNCTAMAQLRIPAAIIIDNLIIDNLIEQSQTMDNKGERQY